MNYRRGVKVLLTKRLHPGLLILLGAFLIFGASVYLNRFERQITSQYEDINQVIGNITPSSLKGSTAGASTETNDVASNQESREATETLPPPQAVRSKPTPNPSTETKNPPTSKPEQPAPSPPPSEEPKPPSSTPLFCVVVICFPF